MDDKPKELCPSLVPSTSLRSPLLPSSKYGSSSSELTKSSCDDGIVGHKNRYINPFYSESCFAGQRYDQIRNAKKRSANRSHSNSRHANPKHANVKCKRKESNHSICTVMTINSETGSFVHSANKKH